LRRFLTIWIRFRINLCSGRSNWAHSHHNLACLVLQPTYRPSGREKCSKSDCSVYVKQPPGLTSAHILTLSSFSSNCYITSNKHHESGCSHITTRSSILDLHRANLIPVMSFLKSGISTLQFTSLTCHRCSHQMRRFCQIVGPTIPDHETRSSILISWDQCGVVARLDDS